VAGCRGHCSSLGTSSILAGTVLTSLDRLLAGDGANGVLSQRAEPQQAGARQAWAPDIPRLFDQVLYLEQMLTTGGGWQDQAAAVQNRSLVCQTCWRRLRLRH